MEHSKGHRRTIGRHSEVATRHVSSRNSLVAFFFGQPKVSTAAGAQTKAPSPTAASAKHPSGRQRRIGEHGQERHQLSRDNSLGSFSSALSKKSAESAQSVRDTPSILSFNTHVSKSDDIQDKGDSRVVTLSMKLGMWESAEVAASPRHRSSKSKDRQRRVLTRDNSAGSNISNISNLSNNSNISILSASSTGSGKSPRMSPGGVYDPVAAAAASRERYFLQAQHDSPPGYMQPPEGSRPIPVREPSFGSHSLSAGSVQSSCEVAAAPTLAPTSQRSPPSPPASQEVSLRSVASHELMVESSPEPSPSSSPRQGAEEVAAGARQPPSVEVRSEPAGASAPGLTPSPAPASTSDHGPRTASLAAGVVPVQSALKRAEQKRSMSPLVSRASGVLSARSSWMTDKADRDAQQRPRVVQFTTSTKSLGAMRTAAGLGGGGEVSEGAALLDGAAAATELALSTTAASADLDIFIEGAVVVEDKEEEGAGCGNEDGGGVSAVCVRSDRIPASPCSVAAGASAVAPAAAGAVDVTREGGEGGVVASDGAPCLTLAELVRRNKAGDLSGLAHEQLEVHLSDADFMRTFRLTREAFHELPQWRQRNQKRAVGLL